MRTIRTTGSADLVFWGTSALAVLLALFSAWRMAWVCDDAFISFRYADNLARGLGLVFNEGERVEGYTNLLWTLWLAVASARSLDLERWSIAWGIVFHCGTVTLLCWQARPGTGSKVLIPVAGLLAAAHPDLAVYATSGLETSLFTFLSFAGFLAAAGAMRPRAWFASSTLFALATMCRPDGIVFFVAASAWAAGWRRASLREILAFLSPYVLVFGALTAWRWEYYGDFLPNTYYAKSADVAWWAQGAHYAWLFFRQYWPMVIAALVGIVLAVRGRRDPVNRARSSRIVLAAFMATAYSIAVVRVGGDFMYARLLIPVCPLLLVSAEFAVGSIRWTGKLGALAQSSATAVGIATMLLLPRPVSGANWDRWITDERDFYVNVRPDLGEAHRAKGEALRPLLADLPVTVAFGGTEARVVYYARPAVAIEAATGLTDRRIARQVIGERGRPGHEKRAPSAYLLDERRVQFAFSPNTTVNLGLQELIPVVLVRFGPWTSQILRWDPAMVATLRRRGALVSDFPEQLDAYLHNIDSVPTERIVTDYAAVRRFYFDTVYDPEREAPFLARLEPDRR